MSHRRARIALAIATLGLVVGLPLLGAWSRRDGPPRCSLDGLPIEPQYQVSIVTQGGAAYDFCCVRCAEHWIEKSGDSAAEVFVTDEEIGQRFSASRAWFVRSSIVTNPATGNRVHVFRSRSDAERHAAAFAGELLVGEDRPFVSVLSP
jgi:hypothetical protein